MKKKQEENLSLFSNLEEYKVEKQENEETKESVEEKGNLEKGFKEAREALEKFNFIKDIKCVANSCRKL